MSAAFVAAAQESQRNPIFTACFSSFKTLWFLTLFQLTNDRVETIIRSDVLKDCNFNFDWSKEYPKW